MIVEKVNRYGSDRSELGSIILQYKYLFSPKYSNHKAQIVKRYINVGFDFSTVFLHVISILPH